MFDGRGNGSADHRRTCTCRCILVCCGGGSWTMVKVAVNIVTFNSSVDIQACLESLKEQTFRDFRTHVLDNDSQDDTIDRIASYDLDLVRSTTNSGFSKAHNDLIRSFPADYALILNPDAILRPD